MLKKMPLYFINIVFDTYYYHEGTSTYEKNTLDRSFIILFMFELTLLNGNKKCYIKKSEKIALFFAFINFLRCFSLKKPKHMIHLWKADSV